MSSPEPDAAARAGTDAEVTGHDRAFTAFISDHEERLAEQRRSAIEAGRRKGGVAGAAMAGAMLVVSEIVEGPPKDDAPVTVEASGDPHDLERDGVAIRVGDVDVTAPPLERLEPVVDRGGRQSPSAT